MAKSDAAEWIRFAEDDLAAATFLLGMHDRKLEIICYHCQQCAEKAVKSLYAAEGLSIPRTHDFRVLATGLRDRYDLSLYATDFAELQPFSVTARYPFEIELTVGDENRAIAAAETVLATCKELLRKRQM